jgi:acyl-ACP thioesterase
MDLRVDSRAIDMFQQCRPSALLGYLQEAATQAALELGASGPQVLEKYNCLWMIARTWVEMDRPLYWNEAFTVHTWHRGGKGASCYRDFDIIRDGRPIGQGVSTWVLVDVDSHKLFHMKDLEEFQGTDGGALCKDKKLFRVKLPETFDGREERPMRYSETDLNGHINNIHYADFACDALHMERHGQGKFVRQFQIGYVGECHAGETIAIDTAVRGDELFARGEGPDEKERFDFAMTLENLK